jgi:hypothetical protein
LEVASLAGVKQMAAAFEDCRYIARLGGLV